MPQPASRLRVIDAAFSRGGTTIAFPCGARLDGVRGGGDGRGWGWLAGEGSAEADR